MIRVIVLGPGNALVVLLFFPYGIVSVVNIFVFGGSVSARRIAYGYSIDDVTATWIEVNLISPDRSCSAFVGTVSVLYGGRLRCGTLSEHSLTPTHHGHAQQSGKRPQ